MADDADMAQIYIEAELERKIQAARAAVATGNSADNCDECGDDIPAKRQQAVPGCRLCFECADYAERLRESRNG